MFKGNYNLLLKKIRLKVHDIFEKRYQLDLVYSFERVQFLLWQNIFSKLNYENEEIYFKTKIQNNGRYLILAQSRILLSLAETFKQEDATLYSKFLIKRMTNYIINRRNQEGLYTLNYPNWDVQDEGIATVWTLLALIKANLILENKNIQEFVLETAHIMIHKLYNEKISLVHTKKQNFWCLNAASTFAYFCSLILESKFDETFKAALNNSISLCINNLDVDGHFPYSEKWRGTYLLLYHPTVIYTLEECLNSKYINDEIRLTLSLKLETAKKFLLKQMDKKFFFIEPDLNKYYRYIISNVSSLVALQNSIKYEIEEKILQNITKFFSNNMLFLCIDKKDRLFNSSLYYVHDQLSTEVLFWMQIYISRGK